MAELLLELFCEEIPARMQAGAMEDLRSLIGGALKSVSLTFRSIDSYVTPHRLVVVVNDFVDIQADWREERRGPRVDAPKKAIEGFLKSVGLEREQIEERETDKGRFLFAVIERKSAVLLSAACEAGSILGGVTRGERRRLREFGHELGLAFQLRDDALDYEAGEDVLGKLPHTDVSEGKVTLPLLLALKRCTPAEHDAVVEVLKMAAHRSETHPAGEADGVELDLAPVIDVVDRYRGVADTVKRAEQHIARAAESIAPFSEGTVKQHLLAAADYAVDRDR